MNIILVVATIIVVSNVFFSYSLIFIERKDPNTTWAWLLIMTSLPGLGFIIYLIFGQNLSRERLFKEKKKLDRNKRLQISKNWDFNRGNKYLSDQYIDLIKMNFNHCEAKYTYRNEVDIYYDGYGKFNQLLKDLNNAKRFIHIEYYIFRRDGKDGIGTKILEVLKRKVREGVEVRLLVDSMGSYTITKRSLKEFIRDGGKFEIFFPGILPHINTRINYRNHRKIVVIDGEYGYTGGFNVGKEYMSLDKKIGFWRDTHIRIRGEAVNDLNDRFLLDWCHASGEKIDDFSHFYKEKPIRDGDVGVQIVTSGPDHNEEYIKNAYIKMINNAKRNVFLETPYFVPDGPMLMALKISALSGVDVRIIIPANPDHNFMGWAASAYIGELLEVGVKVYMYNKGFMHAKSIVCDGEVVTVGTTNMDIRSFSLNFEVNAFIYDARIAKEVEEQFYKDIDDSKIVNIEEYRSRGISIRIRESIIRLLSPIL